MKGRPVPILTVKEDGSFDLDVNALKSVLCQKEIKDKPICIIPVAGAFRKGKSFLINFLLRYLSHQESESKDVSWLPMNDDTDLEGFHWCGGSQRDTDGILLWSKVFTVPTDKGEVAVVLMDTQGAFDRQTSVKTTITVFALALMTSSLFIYNLDENIQEDDLQMLQYFSQYGQLALEESAEAPFQKLIFMIRDWQFPYEKAFGWEGGKQLLDSSLQVTEDQPEELQTLRKDLKSSFDDISCFLLPYPGRAVTNPAFTGSLKGVDLEFQEHMASLVPSLLGPESIIAKKDMGDSVRCKDMVHYFQSYMKIFQSGDMPEPKTILEVTGEANNLASLGAARELYEELIEELVGGEKPYLSPVDLDSEHLRLSELAMSEFDKRKKMGGDEMNAGYRQQLVEEMEETFTQYKAHNESKNIMNVAGTPITLIFIWMMLYLISQIASLLFLGFLLTIASYLQLATVVAGIAWGFSKYSGQYQVVGEAVDNVAGGVWALVVQPMVGQAVQKYVMSK